MKRSQFLVLSSFAQLLYLGLPLVRALKAVDCQLIVTEGLLDLLLSVHHEGSVLRDGFVQRLSANQHELPSSLRGESMLCLFLLVGLAQQAAVHVVNQLLVLIDHLSLVHKDNGVPLSWNRQLEHSARQHVHVKVIGGSPRVDRSGLAFPLARDYLYFYLISLEDFYLVAGVFLVGRLYHLVLALQVDPQLEAKRVLFIRSWDFRVQNASSGCHPLQISRSYLAFAALEVLVVEVALLHVGHSFEASVRVVGESCGQSDFEVVEHEEGIEVSEVLVADNPDDLGSLALVDPSWLEDE